MKFCEILLCKNYLCAKYGSLALALINSVWTEDWRNTTCPTSLIVDRLHPRDHLDSGAHTQLVPGVRQTGTNTPTLYTTL